MRDGRIVQTGAPRDLFNCPAEPFVSQFVKVQRSPAESGTPAMKLPVAYCKLACTVVWLFAAVASTEEASQPVRVGSKVFMRSA